MHLTYIFSGWDHFLVDPGLSILSFFDTFLVFLDPTLINISLTTACINIYHVHYYC